MVYSVVKSGKRVLKIFICDQFNRIGLVNHQKFFEISQRGVSQKYLTYDGFAFIGAIVFASYLPFETDQFKFWSKGQFFELLIHSK